MTTDAEHIDAEHIEDRAAELALGIVDEPERTELLAHAEVCDHCRRLIDELSGTADQVLLVAPEIEPPPGFEGRALTTMGVGPEHVAARPNRRLAVVAAVAAAVVALVGGVVVEHNVGQTPTASESSPGAASVGSSGALRSESGDTVGRAVVVDGAEPVLVMSLDVARVGERYDCVLVLPDGTRRQIGTWAPRGPNHTWSVPLQPSDTAATRLVVSDDDGSSVSTAELR